MRLKNEIARLCEAIERGSEFESRNPLVTSLWTAINKRMHSLTKRCDEAERRCDEYKQFLVENRMLRSDRIVAEQIQQSMLERGYPAFPDFASIDLFADMDPAGEIGGDFYDYFVVDGDHVCFSVADVEGKGIPAALYMAIAKTMIRIRLENGEPLSSVLSSVNEQLCKSSMQKRFITLWIGILQVSTGELTYINAGHNAPILKKKDEEPVFLRERSGIPLASYFSKKRKLPPYTEFKLTLERGDILLLSTDGVTEAMNRDASLFGEEELASALGIYADHAESMRDLTAYIKRQVLKFSANSQQDDDITLLALKRL